MTQEQLVFELDKKGWKFLSSTSSRWVIVKRGSHLLAGESIFTVAAHAARADERE
jgi:hypothetical protein